jgi:lipoprotein NlpD
MKPWRRLALMFSLAVLTAACGSAGVHEPSARHARPAAQPRAVTGPGQYQVQRGDTLYSIAFRNQIDYHDLANWNNIGRDYAIYPGRVLRLTPPGSQFVPAGAAEPAAPTALASRPASTTLPAATSPPPRLAPSTVPPLPPDTAPPPSAAQPGQVSRSIDADLSGPGFDAGHWEWPTRGKLARGFASDGSSKGLDIAGEVGQIVVAAAGGRVVYSGSALKGYGELVIIKHDEQYLSAYGYNRRRLVEEGQQVLAGQPIAELGEGPEQKPLLHFEVRDRGRPVDPLPLLPKR